MDALAATLMPSLMLVPALAVSARSEAHGRHSVPHAGVAALQVEIAESRQCESRQPSDEPSERD